VRAPQDPWFGYGITMTNLFVLAGIGVISAGAAALLFRRR
jgi:LPXTG-motif cell wall-anchored protein